MAEIMSGNSSGSSYDETKQELAAGDFVPQVLSKEPATVDSKEIEKLRKKQRLSAAFTVACAGVALISDGLQNNSTWGLLSRWSGPLSLFLELLADWRPALATPCSC